MRFVALEIENQLDLPTLHRVRERLVGERTALISLETSGASLSDLGACAQRNSRPSIGLDRQFLDGHELIVCAIIVGN